MRIPRAKNFRMSHAAPRLLPENQNLAFVGESVRPAATIPVQLAQRMLATQNRHGRTNVDVVRRVINATAHQQVREGWMIDFPPEMSEGEAALYEAPYQHLRRSLRQHSEGWWTNPNANPTARALIARRERYLSTPIGFAPEFVWVSSEILPDSTLLVVARDDDFIYGVLRSRAFVAWWDKFHSRRTPTLAVDSFPFPWSPERTLSSLTRAEEEARHGVAIAARSGDQASTDAAVAVAYGWPTELHESEAVEKLIELNRTRAG